jgi:hypothetical protein
MPSRERNRNFRPSAQTRTTATRMQGQQVQQSHAVRARPKQRVRNRKKQVRRGSAVSGAQNRLKNFRQASILAVAITGFILILLTPGEAGLLAQDTTPQQEFPDTVVTLDEHAVEDLVQAETAAQEDTVTAPTTMEAADEAFGALRGLWDSFFFNLPKMLVALGALFLAWIITRL